MKPTRCVKEGIRGHVLNVVKTVVEYKKIGEINE